MRFEDERYVRLFTRDTPNWMLAPWQARAVLPLVLRKLDRAGILDLGDDGLEAVAVVVGIPLEIVEPGIAWWIKKGTFEIARGRLVMLNFLDAQEASASNAQRCREKRERARDLARAQSATSSGDDTKRVAGDTKRVARDPRRVGRDTTTGSADPPSRAVPSEPCRAVPPDPTDPSLTATPSFPSPPAGGLPEDGGKLSNEGERETAAPPADASAETVNAWCAQWDIPVPAISARVRAFLEHARGNNSRGKPRTARNWTAAWRDWEKGPRGNGRNGGPDSGQREDDVALRAQVEGLVGGLLGGRRGQ